jgi:aspartyl-tRNA(Asn)/glutamyl-tRNA(Gln) amidotransferase subunit C
MDIEELRVTARLAHIEMDEASLVASFPAFAQMLDFFQAMQAADSDAAVSDFLTRAGESSGASAVSSDFRGDMSEASDTVESELIISKAGESDGRFVLIPNVL